VGWLYSPRFLDHDQPGHPERPDRLRRIVSVLEETGLMDSLHPLSFDPVDSAFLERCHDPFQVRLVRQLSDGGGGAIDGDTFVGHGSFEIACLAAGAAVRGVDAVWDAEVDRAFAAVRPPGHHATGGRSMGFCLFNNVALAAMRALERGAERVAIVDWDVHHGNGTQDIFYEDSQVLFISTHQVPLYPGTGLAPEIGRGEGKGWTVNVPLPPGVGDPGFHRVFDEVVLPAIRRAAPDIILVSAGFDAHFRDPLANLDVSTPGFHALAHQLVEVANEVCEGRMVVCLEGGYDLDAVGWSAAATTAALAGETLPADPLGAANGPDVDVGPFVTSLQKLHNLSSAP